MSGQAQSCGLTGALKSIETRNVYGAANARGEFDSGIAEAMVRSFALNFHPACFVHETRGTNVFALLASCKCVNLIDVQCKNGAVVSISFRVPDECIHCTHGDENSDPPPKSRRRLFSAINGSSKVSEQNHG